MQSFTSMLVQIHNDRSMWAGNAGYYLKSRFTPKEIRHLKRTLEARTYELRTHDGTSVVEIMTIDIPMELITAVKSV